MADNKQKFELLLQELIDIVNLQDEDHSVQSPTNPSDRESLSFEDSGVFINYNQESNKTQPINWINNQTRLNEFNMNTLVSYVAQYADWAAEKSVRYYAETALAPVIADIIKHSAGWTEDSTAETPTGEIFNDYTNSTVDGVYSAVFGENNNSTEGHQFIIGKFNESAKNAIFVVGWGTNDKRANIFLIDKDGNITLPNGNMFVKNGSIFVDNGDVFIPRAPTNVAHAVNKQYVDTEVSRLKQLNQWVGLLVVTPTTYNTDLKEKLTEFVKSKSKVKREPRNGDLVTVEIQDPLPTDPQYPEIWIFLESDPYDIESHDGDWYFYSSQQQLLNASKDTKGLVQIGDNIDVNDGVISVPKATQTTYGVVTAGDNVTIDNDGKISSCQYWIEF